jgi:4-hydroxythreonine-4-phosphate dehydrogenase
MSSIRPILVLTQGDAAGVGPEVLCKMLARPPVAATWRPLVIVERAAIAAVVPSVRSPIEDRLEFLDPSVERKSLEALPPSAIAAIDPVGIARQVAPGTSSAADAVGALAALDLAVDLVRSERAEAVTLPISKQSIAQHCLPGFVGHTGYLAAKAGLDRYGRDYLMTFLAPDLRVALLTTHSPLQQVIENLGSDQIVEALELLNRETHGRIAVAGLNPHAGEGGLIGDEDHRIIEPAVLALYHDQGLIAVKTAAFGAATNWTLGLPFLRTSVDHGTAFSIAGRGTADEAPLRAVIETTVDLLQRITSR